MEVRTVVVALPNLDGGVANWVSSWSENSTAHVSDLADARCHGIIDYNEIIIRIQGKMIRIERTFRLARGLDELLGKGSRDSEECRAESKVLQKASAVPNGILGRVHERDDGQFREKVK